MVVLRGKEGTRAPDGRDRRCAGRRCRRLNRNRALALAATYARARDGYAKDATRIQQDAQAREAESHREEDRGLRLDLGEGLLELGLVLTSLFFLSRQKAVPVIGGLAAAAGHRGCFDELPGLGFGKFLSHGVLSSAGRASPLHGECRRFDPVSTHHKINTLECDFLGLIVVYGISTESYRGVGIGRDCDVLPRELVKRLPRLCATVRR